MHATAAAGHAPTLRLLLARGASVHTRDVWGYTALYLVAFKGTPDAVGVLLQAGSDVNRADSSGQTPLMALARWGQGTDELGRPQLLLEHPRVNLTTRYQGKTPREWAMGRGALAVAAAIDEDQPLFVLLLSVQWSLGAAGHPKGFKHPFPDVMC